MTFKFCVHEEYQNRPCQEFTCETCWLNEQYQINIERINRHENSTN